MIHGTDVVVAMDYGFSEYGPRVQVARADCRPSWSLPSSEQLLTRSCKRKMLEWLLM